MLEKILLLFLGFIVFRYTWKIHKEDGGGVSLLERLIGPGLMLGSFARIVLDFLLDFDVLPVVFMIIFYFIIIGKMKKKTKFKQKFNMENIGNSILKIMGETNGKLSNFNNGKNK